MILESISIDKIKVAAYNPRRDLKPGDPDYEKLKKDTVQHILLKSQGGILLYILIWKG